jgi:hypothetical protein
MGQLPATKATATRCELLDWINVQPP